MMMNAVVKSKSMYTQITAYKIDVLLFNVSVMLGFALLNPTYGFNYLIGSKVIFPNTSASILY